MSNKQIKGILELCQKVHGEFSPLYAITRMANQNTELYDWVKRNCAQHGFTFRKPESESDKSVELNILLTISPFFKDREITGNPMFFLKKDCIQNLLEKPSSIRGAKEVITIITSKGFVFRITKTEESTCIEGIILS